MDRISRYEFKGYRTWFIILCLSGIGIPIAILHLIDNTIQIEYEVEDAEAFLKQHFKKT